MSDTVSKNETFSGLVNFLKLKLDKNHLVKLEPGAFECLGNLEELLLDSNQLASDQFDSMLFKGLKKLRRLNQRGNQLTKLDQETFHTRSDRFKVFTSWQQPIDYS